MTWRVTNDDGQEKRVIELPAATQAEMEAASATTVASTPGRQHYHPGHPKAWINFNGSGTIAIRYDYGVSSITDNGTGDYTVTFSTAFSSTSFCPVASGQLSSSPAGRNYVAGIDTTSTTTSRMRCVAGDGNSYDYDYVYAAYFGDQ